MRRAGTAVVVGLTLAAVVASAGWAQLAPAPNAAGQGESSGANALALAAQSGQSPGANPVRTDGGARAGDTAATVSGRTSGLEAGNASATTFGAGWPAWLPLALAATALAVALIGLAVSILVGRAVRSNAARAGAPESDRQRVEAALAELRNFQALAEKKIASLEGELRALGAPSALAAGPAGERGFHDSPPPLAPDFFQDGPSPSRWFRGATDANAGFHRGGRAEPTPAADSSTTAAFEGQTAFGAAPAPASNSAAIGIVADYNRLAAKPERQAVALFIEQHGVRPAGSGDLTTTPLWFIPVSSATEGVLTPGYEPQKNWGKFYKELAGATARERFGAFYDFEPGDALELLQPAWVSMTDGAPRLISRGVLKGV